MIFALGVVMFLVRKHAESPTLRASSQFQFEHDASTLADQLGQLGTTVPALSVGDDRA